MQRITSLSPEVLQALAAMPEPYLILSPDLVVLTASAAFLRAFRLTRGHLVGQHLTEVFLTQHSFPTGKAIDALITSCQHVVTTKKLKHITLQRYDLPQPGFQEEQQGEINWRILITPVLNPEKKVAYLMLKVREVTKRIHQARLIDQLEEQANFIRQVTATVPDMVSVIELTTGKVEYINRQSLPASGFSYEELTQGPPEKLRELIHPEDQAAVRTYFSSFATATDEEIKTVEYRAKDHLPEWQWFLARGMVFRRHENGTATHCLSVVQNISAQKRAQAETYHYLQVLEQAEAIAGMGSWEYDLATGICQWSAGMYHLFRIQESQQITPDIYLEYACHEDRARARKFIQQLRRGQEPLEAVIRIKREGQIRILQIKAFVTYDGEGQPLKVGGVDLDVTEVKQLEKENLELKLAQQKALLLAILETQEEERRRISESLHNGVGQILYAAKLQLNRIHPVESARFPDLLKEAKQETDLLLSEAIRETRQVSHELIPLLLEEHGLEVAIADFCNRFAHSGVQLHSYCLKERLERHLEVAIYRIAQELVNNIVKHAQATKARIEVFQEGNSILMEAQDDGKGLNQKQFAGTGIGLKTIQDRVKLLEGTWQLDSAPGKGTLITIRLPLFYLPNRKKPGKKNAKRSPKNA